jgi:hypothetical protein
MIPGAPPHHHKAHFKLSTGHPGFWTPPTMLYLLWADSLQWCKLGELLEHTPIHLRLRCVPRQQPCLLFFEASKHCLPLGRRGRVPGRDQQRGGGLLTMIATSEASRSTDEEHSHLLWQHQHHLLFHQPNTSVWSMSRSTYTLYGNVWPSVMFTSSTCQRNPSS